MRGFGFTPITEMAKSGKKLMAGFILVEVLVSAAILTLVIAGIYGVLNIGNMTYGTDMGLLDLHQNARLAMHWMVKELREASGEIDIDLVDEDDDQITFDTPNETGIQYYRDTQNNQLIREYPAGTTKILANDIGSLQFSLNNQLLDIQVTASKKALGRDLSFPSRVKVYLRNE